jgi:hypothetical protein
VRESPRLEERLNGTQERESISQRRVKALTIEKILKMKLNIIAPNQTEIHLNERLADSSKKAVFFFSYSTPVAAKIGVKYYRCEDKFSTTTTRHTNAWLEGVQCEVKPQSWFEKALLIPYGEEARAEVLKM